MEKVKQKKTFILSRYYLDDQHVEDTPPRNNVYEHHEPRPLIFENLDTEGKLPCNIAEASLTSSGSATKLIPIKPKPTYNLGQDLSNPDLQVTSLRFMSLPTNSKVAEPPFVHPCTTVYSNATGNNLSFVGDRQPYMYKSNIDAIHDVTNHLSNIEITRVQGIEPTTSSNLYSGTHNANYQECINYNAANHLPQIRSRDRELNVNSSQNDNGQGRIQLKNKDSTHAAPTKANKRGKPTIPDDIKDVFLSAGIDEQNAADVVVYSSIENFRESCSKINNSELKERLTIVRRQWKNRNCAETSRTNRIERIKGMREEFQRELKKLKDNQKTMAKYQVNAKNNRHTFKH